MRYRGFKPWLFTNAACTATRRDWVLVGAHGRAGDDAAVDGGRRDDSGRLHGEESAHVIKTGITNFAANCFITSFAAQTITNVYLFIPFAGLYSPSHRRGTTLARHLLLLVEPAQTKKLMTTVR